MTNNREKAFDIVRTLRDAGWEAFIAGGAVRDLLMGRTPVDYDVVTRAPHDAIRTVFGKRKIAEVGVTFKVCMVDGIEVAAYRRASAAPGGMEAADSLEEDLARRDLTINALAYCPFTETVVDRHGGIDDLKNRIVRFNGPPDERIDEDPCRIVRACRFLAVLEGVFDSDSLDALKRRSRLVETRIAPERLRLEILKAMACRKPGLFFRALHDIGALTYISPGFEACFDRDGGPHHGETIAEHAMMVGDFLPARNPLLRIAGFWHDHGKPVTACVRDGKLTFYGHARKSAGIAADELRRLTFSNREIAYVQNLIRHHMRSLHDAMTPTAVRRLLRVLRDDDIRWKDWLRLKLADNRGNLKATPYDRRGINGLVMRIFRQTGRGGKATALSVGDLAVNGHDVMQILGIAPGPAVGKVMKNLLDRVVGDPALNIRETLVELIETEFLNGSAGLPQAPREETTH